MAVKVAKKLVHLTEGTKKISKAKQKKKSIAWFKKKVGESAKGFKRRENWHPEKYTRLDMTPNLKQSFLTGINFLLLLHLMRIRMAF